MPRHVTPEGIRNDEPQPPHPHSQPQRRAIDTDQVWAFAAGCVTPVHGTGDEAAYGNDRGNDRKGIRGNDRKDTRGNGGPTVPGGCVGIETEWLIVDTQAVHCLIPPARTLASLARIPGTTPGPGGPVLPGGSRITFEPGGQLELSGPPAELTAAVRASSADLNLVRSALAVDGLALVGMGVDPLRVGMRQTTASRYAAMEEHFRTGGGASGTVMMYSTASVQVNLDLGGSPAEAARRFQLVHALGPVLTALFAASPAYAGRRTGWRSTRQAVWDGIDASRTRPVAAALTAPGSGDTEPDLVDLWARYLLDAKLMMVENPARAGNPEDDHHFVPVRDDSTFGDWLAGRGPVTRPPTREDLSYHATTVFPPVRPRGWWELRYLDAQPGDGWQAAVAMPTVLLDDPVAADGAFEACLAVAHRWPAAAMLGMADEPLRRAAVRCVDLAVSALRRRGATDLAETVESFAGRYLDRGRCPADELTERLLAIGPAGLLREEAHRCVSLV
ncbi:gamma-glutamylcysteine synthetase [Frankia sp. CcI6]|nr:MULTISPECIES: ergothioneine biosynthesis glutamate--cysteine ligase EgtA [unclassified Frankia]ETA03983.1 gamma-glutamylcysteine synthetase [Frankia sp. CcI6]OFB44084.1 ergothioneine biosynthesis glutamate--cysteine ligase EgtA [Frankia sp. CgIM4]OHV54960.1 ergothioneine biosynthesis glutamate--cysteine ligase EgtA [Frankia sp. CgIS1]